MKILFVPTMYPNTYNTFSNIFFRDQAEALVRYGHQVSVLAIVPVTLQQILSNRKFDFGLKVFEKNGVLTYLCQIPVPPKSRRLQQFLRKSIGLRVFRKYLESNKKPEIQHVHTYRAAVTARTIHEIFKIPYVITEHSSAFTQNLLSRYDITTAKKAYSESSFNCAVSPFLAKCLSDLFTTDFSFIPNLVDTDFFSPGGIEKNITKKSDYIRLLHVANLVPVKNQSMLIRAFSKIVSSMTGVNLELRIAGDGPEKQHLISLCNELGLRNKVVFLGRLSREDVRSEMWDCDCFVLSSTFETFGVVLLEAMACGKPVLSTRSGGPEAIITGSSLGYLTDVTEESLADGLGKMISYLDRFNGEEIRGYIEENFSEVVIARKLTEVYKVAI